MKVRWIDEHGEEQTWNSWEDALCGRFGATKILPAGSTEIQVRFRSQPGGRKVHGVDRRNRSAWTRQGEEVIELRPSGLDEVSGRGVDAWFEIRGPITHHVWRAWNSCNEGMPESWEWWPDFPEERRAAPPATLQAADAAAPWPGLAEMSPTSASSDEATCASAVTGAMSRLVAAAAVLLAVRRRTLRTLEELNGQITKQSLVVQSCMAAICRKIIVRVGRLFRISLRGASIDDCCLDVAQAPPSSSHEQLWAVNLRSSAEALGAGSAAAGVGMPWLKLCLRSREKGRSLAKLMETDVSEQLAFESVESELRCALSSAAARRRSSPRRHTGRALAVYTQTANLMLVRSAKYVTLTQAGTETMLIAGRVLGGLGAGLAVGVAVHGWSTTKPMQKLVQEKIAEVERSIEYLDGVHQRISGALRCPCCEEPLRLGASSALRRCPQFHCFHAACVGEDGSCPLCATSVSDLRSSEQLPALLGLVGLRDLCALTVDSITVRKGAELVQRLGGRMDEVRRLISGVQKETDEGSCQQGEETPSSRRRQEQALHEDADTHEAWQEALAQRSPADLQAEELEALLLGRRGMPLKYRHLLWPELLSGPKTSSGSVEALAVAELPQKVLEQIDADVPRTRRDLVSPERRDALRRVLRAVAAKRPSVGYAQGMNQLAAVLLKLGFDEDKSCWMMDAIME
ncbi:tbc-6, partial [Symbiodinium pilosum]